MIHVTDEFNRKLPVEITCTPNAIIITVQGQHFNPPYVSVFIPMDDVRALGSVASCTNNYTELARLLKHALALLSNSQTSFADLPDIPPSTPPLPDIPTGGINE